MTSRGTTNAPYWPLTASPATPAGPGGGVYTQGMEALGAGRMDMAGAADGVGQVSANNHFTDGTGAVSLAGSADVVIAATGTVTFSGKATADFGRYPLTVINDGAAAYYRLDDPAGSTTVKDTISGTAAPEAMTPSTPPTFQESPIADQYDATAHAVYFPGPNGTPFAVPSVFDGGDWSIEFWLNTTSTAGSSGTGGGVGNQWYTQPNIFGGDLPGAAADFGICMAGGQIGVGVGESDTTYYTATTYNDGKNHHVVATRSAASGDITIYVDGQQAGTWTGPTGARNGANPQWIAGDPTGGSGGNWVGTLQEVALYNTVLTSTQVVNHYTLGNGLPSGSGNLSFTGSASPGVNGSGVGTLTLAGSASGSVLLAAAPGGYGAVTLTGTATGTAGGTGQVSGTGNGVLTLDGAATGTSTSAPTVGGGAGSLSFSGTAPGQVVFPSTSIGTFSLAGLGAGTSQVAGATLTGVGAGTTTFSGASTGVGHVNDAATGTGALVLSGSALTGVREELPTVGFIPA